MKPVRRDIFRPDPADDRLAAERPCVGLYGETSLHDALKRRYAAPGDRLEALVDGYVVDLVRADGELVEIQTAGLRKLKDKAAALCSGPRRLRIVYPVVVEKLLVRLDPRTGRELSARKSPKRGDAYAVFDELVTASWILTVKNLSLELAFVTVRESRRRDGAGSWRRRGDTIVDRELVSVLETRRFSRAADWRALIPRRLPEPFGSAELGDSLGIGAERARKILYTLAKAGLVLECGKAGRRKMYVRVAASSRKPSAPASRVRAGLKAPT